MDAAQVIRDAVTLAGLRRDGHACAVVSTPLSSGLDPVALWRESTAERCVFSNADGWMIGEGTAWSCHGDGPGRGADLAAAAAWMRSAVASAPASDSDDMPLLTAWRFAESAEHADGVWSAVPGWRLWIPQRLRWQRGDGSGREWRATMVRAGEDPAVILQRLLATPTSAPRQPAQPWPQLSADLHRQLDNAIDWLGEGVARKVVWAAAADLPRAEPEQALRSIIAHAARGAGCAYAVDLADGACFMGVTPEPLAQVHRGQLDTVALAGTAPRSTDPAADRALAQGLLDGTKERKEHNLVVEHLLSVLRGRCHPFTVADRPQLRSLPRLHHLATPVRAQLRNTSAVAAAAALHPTPAVAGLPVATAVRHLARHEGFDRGLYAGVLGWLAGDDVQLWVALRGAVLRDGACRAFAGAGLVESSHAAAEAQEIRTKLDAIAHLLGAP